MFAHQKKFLQRVLPGTKIPALAMTRKRKFLQIENPPPLITLLRIVLRRHIYQYL